MLPQARKEHQTQGEKHQIKEIFFVLGAEFVPNDMYIIYMMLLLHVSTW